MAKFLSVVLYISGIFIYCAHVKKEISPCFFQLLIFGANSGVKGQKMTQNDRKLCGCTLISGSIHHMIMVLGTHI